MTANLALDNAAMDGVAIKLDRRDDLEEMNARYAVVKIGGKTRVVSMEDGPSPNSKLPVFSTISDFTAFHANPKKLIEQPNGNLRQVGIGRWWINHERRRQLDGIVYAPNEQVAGKLNLWQGYGCRAFAGDWGLFRDHLHQVICSGNDDHLDYLLGWMANAIQNPARQGEVAIVLRGKEGTGKGVLAKQFGRLFGSHFRHISHGKHLVGHFNAHLQNCSLLFADEAFFAGDRAHESALKALITEETILIEPKGIDPYQVRNCIHLIMASNSDWVVPAGAYARRYFVLDVADKHKQDSDYFAKLLRQMDNGGREALLHYLLSFDLEEGRFDLRKVPPTSALADQKSRSLRGIDRLVETIAHEGRLPSPDAIYPYVAITSGEPQSGFYVEVRKLVPDLKHESSIVIKRTLTKEWGCEHWHSGHRNGIKFPPLHDLRRRFDAKFGQQTWPDLPSGWDPLDA